MGVKLLNILLVTRLTLQVLRLSLPRRMAQTLELNILYPLLFFTMISAFVMERISSAIIQSSKAIILLRVVNIVMQKAVTRLRAGIILMQKAKERRLSLLEMEYSGALTQKDTKRAYNPAITLLPKVHMLKAISAQL